MEISYHPKGTTNSPFGYIKFVPNGYNGVDKLPVVIFHHGKGEAGDGTQVGLNNLLKIALPKLLKEGARELEAIVICPQHSTGFIPFDRDNVEGTEIKQLLNYVRALPNVDLNRIYVTGLSAGSCAVFKYVFFFPEFITAAWAVAVKSSYTPPNRACEGLPVLLVSNELDSPGELNGMITYLNNVKVDLKMDIGPGSAHNSWDRAYGDQENYDWLFSKTRGSQIPQYTDITSQYDEIILSLESQLAKLKQLRLNHRIYNK